MRSKYGHWPGERYGARNAILRFWVAAPGPIGSFRIAGDLFPSGEHFSAQLFAVSHGYAMTALGRVRLDVDTGRFVQWQDG